MVGIPGDATKEESEKKAMRELKGQLVGISTERTVTIDAATAAMLVELLPSDEELEETEEEKQKFSMKAAAPAAKPAAAKETRAQLEAKTKEELVDMADDEDVDASHSQTKAEIIDAILKSRK
jgi:hypothetical protein